MLLQRFLQRHHQLFRCLFFHRFLSHYDFAFHLFRQSRNVVDAAFRLQQLFDELELSVRAHNCLINAGIKRVIDLVNMAEEEVLKIKNFGKKSLNEVKESMKVFGLSFGMHINEEDVKKVLEANASVNK
jgi:DNA-directed RNA polymerase alpha subunit